MKQWLTIFTVDYILQLSSYIVAIIALSRGFFHARHLKVLTASLQACQQRLSIEQLANQRSQHQLTLINSRVDMLESQFSDIHDVQEQLNQQQQHQGAYRKASKMIQTGSSIDEIMRECDITRAEAELLMSLQGYQEQPA